jgi:hypothetical protein
LDDAEPVPQVATAPPGAVPDFFFSALWHRNESIRMKNPPPPWQSGLRMVCRGMNFHINQLSNEYPSADEVKLKAPLNPALHC